LQFHARVVPIISKLFANTDRAMRMPLLEHLPQFAALLPPNILNEHIFPHLAGGFTDAAPLLREATVKAIVVVAPLLNARALGHVMRAFAALQRDDEPAIRTNTTICLGKITQYLDEQTRARVLIAAFGRALLDPFAPARRAGAMSLAATQAFHSASDAARKVLPAVAPLAIDADAEVRKAALQCLGVYVAKLEAESRRMAAREAGHELPEKETDALQAAASVAQESVAESMTWVSSMLGGLGLASAAKAASDVGKAAGGAAAKPTTQPAILQPTLAEQPTPSQPTPAAAAAASSGGGGGGGGGGPAAPPAPTGADGWGSNDDLNDMLGDADFSTAFAEPSAPPPPPPTSASVSVESALASGGGGGGGAAGLSGKATAKLGATKVWRRSCTSLAPTILSLLLAHSVSFSRTHANSLPALRVRSRSLSLSVPLALRTRSLALARPLARSLSCLLSFAFALSHAERDERRLGRRRRLLRRHGGEARGCTGAGAASASADGVDAAAAAHADAPAADGQCATAADDGATATHDGAVDGAAANDGTATADDGAAAADDGATNDGAVELRPSAYDGAAAANDGAVELRPASDDGAAAADDGAAEQQLLRRVRHAPANAAVDAATLRSAAHGAVDGPSASERCGHKAADPRRDKDGWQRLGRVVAI
jgi:hypothetical protein